MFKLAIPQLNSGVHTGGRQEPVLGEALAPVDLVVKPSLGRGGGRLVAAATGTPTAAGVQVGGCPLQVRHVALVALEVVKAVAAGYVPDLDAFVFTLKIISYIFNFPVADRGNQKH